MEWTERETRFGLSIGDAYLPNGGWGGGMAAIGQAASSRDGRCH